MTGIALPLQPDIGGGRYLAEHDAAVEVGVELTHEHRILLPLLAVRPDRIGDRGAARELAAAPPRIDRLRHAITVRRTPDTDRFAAITLPGLGDDRGSVRQTGPMAEFPEARVAVYIDFDNIVISQYDHVHGRGTFIKEKAKNATGKTAEKLDAATVDLGAILDFASSFGTLALSRAYADWSAPANSRYRTQLVERAVDLVQMFPTSGSKNGADIRLSIDVMEDLFRLPDITHVLIVAGDSDYIPLAQNVRRLGRTVVAVGVTGSTSQAFKNAVDEFSYYADLPGVDSAPPVLEPVESEPAPKDPQAEATALLERALKVGRRRDDVDDWLAASAVKSQMKRLESSFDEKTLGFKSFTEFVRSRDAVAELREDGQNRSVRLRDRG